MIRVQVKVSERLHMRTQTYREYDSPRWYPANKYERGELAPHYPVPAVVQRERMHDGNWMYRFPIPDGFDVQIISDEGVLIDGWYSADDW